MVNGGLALDRLVEAPIAQNAQRNGLQILGGPDPRELRMRYRLSRMTQH